MLGTCCWNSQVCRRDLPGRPSLELLNPDGSLAQAPRLSSGLVTQENKPSIPVARKHKQQEITCLSAEGLALQLSHK